MWRVVMAASVVCGALLVVACSDDDAPDESVGECDEYFRGREFDRSDDLDVRCDLDGGVIEISTTVEDCYGDELLWSNQVAWGITGSPGQLHEETGSGPAPPDGAYPSCTEAGAGG